MKLYKAYLSDFSQEEYNKYYSMLDPTRKKSVDRMKNPTDKRLSVLGESLARRAISNYFSVDEESIKFTRNENGKPSCVGLDIHFSVSHSKDIACCAISDKPIGADIEKIRFCEPRVAKFCCLESDLIYLFGQDKIPDSFDEDTLLRFFTLWTAKEAYIKLRGEKMANIKDFSYDDIKNKCQTVIENGYALTICRE